MTWYNGREVKHAMTDDRVNDVAAPGNGQPDHAFLHARGIPHDHDRDGSVGTPTGAGHVHDVPSEYGELADHEAEYDHEYMHAHGIPHVHTHSHAHAHEHTKAVLNRLSRAIGHLQSVRQMVEDGRDCSEVLVQIAAVRSAIDNTGKIILQDHLKHCIVEAAREGDQAAIDDLCRAIDKYMK